MKKVGIVTVYGESNYGNKLQNYALIKIYSKMGADVDTLQVYQSAFLRSKKDKLFDAIKNVIAVSPIKSKYKNMRIRKNNFRTFSARYLNLTKPYCTKDAPYSMMEEYDILSVGSDQVWNDVDFDLDDVNYFTLNEVKNVKKISFAASIGKENFQDSYVETFKKNLKDFELVSCREMSGVIYLNSLLGEKCISCMDPTLFLDSDEWRKLERKPNWLNDSHYILEYFLGGCDVEQVGCYEQMGITIINLMDVNSEAYTASPEEFLYLINHARIVLTDSFHACVFSMIFKKDYVVFERNKQKSSMTSRIDSLFKLFKVNGDYGTIIQAQDYIEFDCKRKAEANDFLIILGNIIRDGHGDD